MSQSLRALGAAAVLAATATGALASTAHAAPLALTSRLDSIGSALPSNAGDRVAVADLNGDGIDDQAIAEPNLVRVVFGARGSAAAASALSLTTPSPNTGNLAVSSAGDVDGDGIGDLLVSPQGGPGAWLVYGAASSPASVRLEPGPRVTSFSTGSWGPAEAHAIGIGDFDGDGKDDVVVPSKTGSGRENGVSSAAIVAGGPRARTLSTVNPGGRVTVLKGYHRCTTSFHITSPFISYDCRAPDVDVVGIGDFDGDGRSDLYLAPRVGGASFLVLGRALTGGTIQAEAPGERSVSLSALAIDPGTAGYWRSFRAVGDVDGDGFDDVAILTSRALGGKPVVLRGRVNPPAALAASEPVLGIEARAGSGVSVLGAAGDQDGDGRDDLLVEHIGLPSESVPEIDVARLPAGATSFARSAQTAPAGGLPLPDAGYFQSAATAGDLDGDGAPDLLLANGGLVLRYTHGGGVLPPAKPRLEIEVTVDNGGQLGDLPMTVTTVCDGVTRTQTVVTNRIATVGADGSLALGAHCTVKTAIAYLTAGPDATCRWKSTITFRGKATGGGADLTIGADPNRWLQRWTCPTRRAG